MTDAVETKLYAETLSTVSPAATVSKLYADVLSVANPAATVSMIYVEVLSTTEQGNQPGRFWLYY